MGNSLEWFLDETAKRGSWYGGGSAAALTCALAASLLEKLANQQTLTRAMRTIRTRCATLTHQDAKTFARVIRATARGDRLATQRALKAAIDIPRQVYVNSQQLLKFSYRIKQTLHPKYQVDLRCAQALAKASGQAARALVMTNLSWLGDGAYRARLAKQLKPWRHGG